jgi:hypothetical protein
MAQKSMNVIVHGNKVSPGQEPVIVPFIIDCGIDEETAALQKCAVLP